MIINSAICRLSGSHISLPGAITGPILGGEETRLYSLLEEPKAPAKYVEVLTTSINPQDWADLWRIEVETYDRVGTTMRLVQFLNHKGINVIASEAATNSFGRRHTISFIANCVGYSDSTDGDHNSRYRNPRALMERLSEGIELHFFEQLTLNDRGYLRVKIRRMSTLYSLHNEHLVQKQRIMISTGGREAIRGRLRLPSECLMLLREHVSNNLWYSPSVDTKNRVVRTLIFGMSDSGVRHFQIKMNNCSSMNLARLFELVASYQANIVKHTIQPIYSRYSRPECAARIDIALEWKNVSGGERLKKLIRLIENDRKLIEAGVSMLKVDGEPYDRQTI